MYCWRCSQSVVHIIFSPAFAFRQKIKIYFSHYNLTRACRWKFVVFLCAGDSDKSHFVTVHPNEVGIRNGIKLDVPRVLFITIADHQRRREEAITFGVCTDISMPSEVLWDIVHVIIHAHANAGEVIDAALEVAGFDI